MAGHSPNGSPPQGNVSPISGDEIDKNCILCAQPHTTPGCPGTQLTLALENIFKTLYYLPQDEGNELTVWCCSQCEPILKNQMEKDKMFKLECAKRVADLAKVAQIVVDSVKASNYLDSNSSNTTNMFHSTRSRIYERWKTILKTRSRISRWGRKQVPKLQQQQLQRNNSAVSISQTTPQPQKIPDNTYKTSPAKAPVIVNANTNVTQQGQQPTTSNTSSALSQQRIVSGTGTRAGGLLTSISQPNPNSTKRPTPTPAEPAPAEENNSGVPKIVAVQSLADRVNPIRTRHSSGGSIPISNLNLATEVGSQSTLPSLTDDNEPSLRRTRSLMDLSTKSERTYTANKIDSNAATIAASALAIPPKQRNIRTSTGSKVRVIYTPDRPGSVRVKRDKDTGAITELHTGDENYMDAIINDSKKGILILTPKKGGQPKTFRYTPNAKQKPKKSPVPGTISNSGSTERRLGQPKSPSPPRLERMDVNVNLASGSNGAGTVSSTTPKKGLVPSKSFLTLTTAGSRTDGKTPDSTTTETTTPPPTLDSLDVTPDNAGVPSGQQRISGRSGRPIKRPYNDSATWISSELYEREFDKIIGDENDGPSRSKTPKRSDETRERSSSVGGPRARRGSSRQPSVNDSNETGEAGQEGEPDANSQDNL